MSATIAAPPTWDLSDLFASREDPKLERTLAVQKERSGAFAAKYRARIKSGALSPTEFAEAIRDYESIVQAAELPLHFAQLLYSTNTGDPANGAFVQKTQEAVTEINLNLVFFELEILEIPDDRMAEYLADPALSSYKRYLELERQYKPHRLTEPEEKILEEKANTGARAFGRLFEEILSNYEFSFRYNNQQEKLNLAKVLSKLRDPNRGVRQAAATCLSAGLEANRRLLTFVFNTLLQDKNVDDRLRSYQYPEQSRHMANELPRDLVEMVVQRCEAHQDLVARYYRVKREILGLDELTHYDRYAPLFEAQERVGFDTAREIVLNSFQGFSAEMRDAAAEFFDKGWIDAKVVPGKMGGAYCASPSPHIHPYVFMNYQDKMDDVMTLAHELGHGVHGMLSRAQTRLNYHPTLCLAETASTFGEMLVFENVVKDCSLQDKLALHAEKIEGTFATIFRQASMFRFEQDVHAHRRTKGELSWEQYGEYWQARQQAMFGDSVILGEEHKSWWSYVPHFLWTPFYVYAYSFGEMLVFGLYQLYKSGAPGFRQNFLALLEAGGSESPLSLTSRCGIDISQPSFWDGALAQVANLVTEFERLWGEYH
jgi:oligoendopeptidase F